MLLTDRIINRHTVSNAKATEVYHTFFTIMQNCFNILLHKIENKIFEMAVIKITIINETVNK